MTLERILQRGGFTAAVVAALISISAPVRAAEILNVSYDVTRKLYQDLNPAFSAAWKTQTGEDLQIAQSHGGSSKQARSVIDGLDADVVTMNSPLDIDAIADKGGLLPRDWAKQFPANSSPSWSTILFVVRKNNPKKIRDWNDLVRPGVSVIIPNPKTSGNGRYSFLGAYEYARRAPGGSEASARAFVGQLFANVPVLETGGRGATTTFAQRGIGDVLLTFENEVALLHEEVGNAVEVIVPSLSVRADNPVAIVQKYAAKKGNVDRARAYLQFHYSAAGQEILARNNLRPIDQAVLARHTSQFPAVKVFDVEKVYGSWAKAQTQHFADGGVFDQIYAKRR